MIRQHIGQYHVTAHEYRSFKFGDWQEKFDDLMSFTMCTYWLRLIVVEVTTESSDKWFINLSIFKLSFINLSFFF